MTNYRLTNDETEDVFDDMAEYQFVPTEIDDNLNLHTVHSSHVAGELPTPRQPSISDSPQLARSARQHHTAIPAHVKNE